MLFEQLGHDLAQTAQDKGLRLRIRPSSVWVMSDATLVYRILLNLVGNALRYTEHGGVLRPRDHFRVANWCNCRFGTVALV